MTGLQSITSGVTAAALVSTALDICVLIKQPSIFIKT